MATMDEPRQRLFCGHCGQENPPTHRFCSACGSAITPPSGNGGKAAEAKPTASTQVPPVPTSRMAAPTPGPSPVPGEGSLVNRELEEKRGSESQTPLSRNGGGAGGGGGQPVFTGIALERERDRLLTLVNVQRMRGQTAEARKTLEEILAICEGMPPRQLAPTQEMIGDLFATEQKWDAALAAFKKATELDPSRVSAERKFAELTLRISDITAEKRLADAMMRGGDVSSLLATNALATDRGRRNAGVAMLLSSVIPGFGQFYNGELIKGAVLIGVYALTLLYFALSPDHDLFMRKFLAIVTVHSKYANAPVSPLSVVAGIVLVGDWLYSIVDAPFMAAKTPKSALGPTIDKTGWEV